MALGSVALGRFGQQGVDVLDGFKKFIVQGNAVELAVGVVIGAAFGAVVNSIVDGVLGPIISLVSPGDGLAQSFAITLKDATDSDPAVVMKLGAVIDAALKFLLVAAAVYFVIVLPMNKLNERRKRQQAEPTEMTNEERMIELLEQIAAK
jgi:large conductance mechanosensitive channel